MTTPLSEYIKEHEGVKYNSLTEAWAADTTGRSNLRISVSHIRDHAIWCYKMIVAGDTDEILKDVYLDCIDNLIRMNADLEDSEGEGEPMYCLNLDNPEFWEVQNQQLLKTTQKRLEGMNEPRRLFLGEPYPKGVYEAVGGFSMVTKLPGT